MYTHGVMSRKDKIIVIALIGLVAFAGSELSASEIYHWVDEDGVSHFSQQPPAKDTPNVSSQKIVDTTPSAGIQAEDVFNTAAHEEHMAEFLAQGGQERLRRAVEPGLS